MKYFFFPFILLFLYSCAHAESNFEKLIIGTWKFEYNVINKEKIEYDRYQRLIFNKDGSYQMFSNRGKKGKEGKGKWWLDGDKLHRALHQAKDSQNNSAWRDSEGAELERLTIQHIDQNTMGLKFRGLTAYYKRVK